MNQLFDQLTSPAWWTATLIAALLINVLLKLFGVGFAQGWGAFRRRTKEALQERPGKVQWLRDDSGERARVQSEALGDFLTATILGWFGGCLFGLGMAWSGPQEWVRWTAFTGAVGMLLIALKSAVQWNSKVGLIRDAVREADAARSPGCPTTEEA